MTRRIARPAFAATFLLGVLVAAIAAGAGPGGLPRIVVGSNVHVSAAHPDWAHYELYLSADPVAQAAEAVRRTARAGTCTPTARRSMGRCSPSRRPPERS